MNNEDFKLSNLIITIIFISFCINIKQCVKIKFSSNNLNSYNYMYHSTDFIQKELQNTINNKCNNNGKILNFKNSNTFKDISILKNKNINDYNKYLNLYEITNINTPNIKKLKVFILAGEHSREMITVEFAYHFIKLLCSNSIIVKDLLKKFIFRIIPNANPLARKKAEEGDYCKRTNLNNVDLNRNWNFNWLKNVNTAYSDENTGEVPFSEVESLYIKNCVNEFNPILFLTVHSGTNGLFYPYGSIEEDDKVQENIKIKKIRELQLKIKKHFCNSCSVGSPSKILGYVSHGNGMDYVFDKLNIPYSFAWEIYSDKPTNKIVNVPNKNLYEDINFNKITDFNNIVSSFNNKILKTNMLEFSSNYILKNNYNNSNNKLYLNNNKINMHCLSSFNPIDELSYNYTIENWIKALIYAVEYVLASELNNN